MKYLERLKESKEVKDQKELEFQAQISESDARKHILVLKMELTKSESTLEKERSNAGFTLERLIKLRSEVEILKKQIELGEKEIAELF